VSERWERLPDETDKAFAAFCVYRDLSSGRSIEKVQEKLGKNAGYIRVLYDWSSKNKWVDRVKAYDDYLDSQRRAVIEQEQIKAQSEVIANELSDYRTMHLAVQKRLDLLVGAEFASTLSDMSDLMNLIKSVDTYGRRAVGLAEKLTATDITSAGKALPTWAEWVQSALNDNSEPEENAD
jgi:hypothetical protein